MGPKKLVNRTSGSCYKCSGQVMGPDWRELGKKPVNRIFILVRAVFDPKPKGAEVIDCWECSECHELVPVDTWGVYQRTGDIVVKQQRRT